MAVLRNSHTDVDQGLTLGPAIDPVSARVHFRFGSNLTRRCPSTHTTTTMISSVESPATFCTRSRPFAAVDMTHAAGQQTCTDTNQGSKADRHAQQRVVTEARCAVSPYHTAMSTIRPSIRPRDAVIWGHVYGSINNVLHRTYATLAALYMSTTQTGSAVWSSAQSVRPRWSRCTLTARSSRPLSSLMANRLAAVGSSSTSGFSAACAFCTRQNTV